MEQTTELGGNARSFAEHVKCGFRTTGCMLGVFTVIVLLAIRKLFS